MCNIFGEKFEKFNAKCQSKVLVNILTYVALMQKICPELFLHFRKCSSLKNEQVNFSLRYWLQENIVSDYSFKICSLVTLLAKQFRTYSVNQQCGICKVVVLQSHTRTHKKLLYILNSHQCGHCFCNSDHIDTSYWVLVICGIITKYQKNFYLVLTKLVCELTVLRNTGSLERRYHYVTTASQVQKHQHHFN